MHSKLLLLYLIVTGILTIVRLIRFFRLYLPADSDSRFHQEWGKGQYLLSTIRRSAFLTFLWTALFAAVRSLLLLVNPDYPYSNERSPGILVISTNAAILLLRVVLGLGATLVLFTIFSVLEAMHQRRLMKHLAACSNTSASTTY